MRYNLLIDPKYEMGIWKFTNCTYKNGYLESTNSIFGMSQELTLSKLDKLYLRCLYKSLSNGVFEIKIGIQVGDTLAINKKSMKPSNKFQLISMIDLPKDTKITVHIIFESKDNINKVAIKEPILVDLTNIHKATWIRYLLDKNIKYVDGYSYKNDYIKSEITNDLEDFKELSLDTARIGSIFDLKENKTIVIKAKFIINQYYVIKLKFEEINKFGNIYLRYGCLTSTRIGNQIFLVIKANDRDKLELIIENNDLISYQVNLQNILIINIQHMRLVKEDIPYLPFI